MDDEEDSEMDSPLLNNHKSRERLGILRIFHHKLYNKNKDESEQKTSCCKSLYYNYCQKNKSVSWGLSIGLVFLITGVLCVTYGFMVPGIYKTLSAERNSSDLLQSGQRSKLPETPFHRKEEKKEKHNMTLYRDVFVIMGLVIFAIGGLQLSVFLLWPVYEKDDVEKSPFHSPIYVEYELPECTPELPLKAPPQVVNEENTSVGCMEVSKVQPEQE